MPMEDERAASMSSLGVGAPSLSALSIDLLAACLKPLIDEDVTNIRLACVSTSFENAVTKVLGSLEVAELSNYCQMKIGSGEKVLRNWGRLLRRCPATRAVVARVRRPAGEPFFRLSFQLLDEAPFELLESIEVQDATHVRLDARCLPALRSLTVFRAAVLVHAGVLPRLERLQLQWAQHADDTQVGITLSQVRHTLEALVLKGCERVGTQPPEFLLPCNLPRLASADFSFTSIGDGHLALLAEAAPALRTLTLGRPADNLWLTGNWTDGGLAELRRRLPALEVKLVSA